MSNPARTRRCEPSLPGRARTAGEDIMIDYDIERETVVADFADVVETVFESSE